MIAFLHFYHLHMYSQRLHDISIRQNRYNITFPVPQPSHHSCLLKMLSNSCSSELISSISQPLKGKHLTILFSDSRNLKVMDQRFPLVTNTNIQNTVSEVQSPIIESKDPLQKGLIINPEFLPPTYVDSESEVDEYYSPLTPIPAASCNQKPPIQFDVREEEINFEIHQLLPLNQKRVTLITDNLKKLLQLDILLVRKICLEMILCSLSDAAKKVTSKQAKTCYGFFVEGTDAYLHLKTPYGSGFFKWTFQALRVNLINGQIVHIAHKKPKPSSDVSQIIAEANRQKNLHHPNIAHLVNFHVHSNGSKIDIYEDFYPSNLLHALETNALCHTQKVQIAFGIANALYFLHHLDPPLVHCDVKLDNVLLTDHAVAKLADFGECCPVKSIFRACTKILSPENIMKKSKNEHFLSSFEGDIYHFGLVLWHLFNPHLPSNHLDKGYKYPQTSEEMMEDWSPIDDTQNIRNLTLACLKKEPSDRPDIHNVLIQLRSILIKNHFDTRSLTSIALKERPWP